jgi:hypothetical protein
MDRMLALPREDREELRKETSGFVAREWTWQRAADRLLEAGT